MFASLKKKIGTKLIALLLPSKWVKWLNGKKTILGCIQLALLALVYLAPAEWGGSELAKQIADFLTASGLDLVVLDSGVAFLIIGLAHKVLKLAKIAPRPEKKLAIDVNVTAEDLQAALGAAMVQLQKQIAAKTAP